MGFGGKTASEWIMLSIIQLSSNISDLKEYHAQMETDIWSWRFIQIDFS